jgi:DNA (cytosine-5)-methyltransferase 1
MELTHGSLFTGIGGFDEGAAAAGFTNMYNCEVNPFCNRFLKKKHPKAKQYADITTIQEIEKTTVISAGFPCQDISVGKCDKAQGLFGPQSSLFFEAIRVIDLARPDYVFFENSPVLLRRGMHYVLTALAKIGYMCEWRCLQASDFGYPHKRERIYIIAYPISKRRRLLVFRPIETISLHAQWTPTPAYLRVSNVGAKPLNLPGIVSTADVVPGFSKYIHAYGNAVMPVVAEYLFQCVKTHLPGA